MLLKIVLFATEEETRKIKKMYIWARYCPVNLMKKGNFQVEGIPLHVFFFYNFTHAFRFCC